MEGQGQRLCAKEREKQKEEATVTERQTEGQAEGKNVRGMEQEKKGEREREGTVKENGETEATRTKGEEAKAARGEEKKRISRFEDLFPFLTAPLCYVHIPKTGGKTILAHLKDPVWVHHFSRTTTIYRLWLAETKPTLACLRNPTDRFISEWLHYAGVILQLTPQHASLELPDDIIKTKLLRAHISTFEEFVSWESCHNTQVKFLLGYGLYDDVSLTEQHVHSLLSRVEEKQGKENPVVEKEGKENPVVEKRNKNVVVGKAGEKYPVVEKEVKKSLGADEEGKRPVVEEESKSKETKSLQLFPLEHLACVQDLFTDGKVPAMDDRVIQDKHIQKITASLKASVLDTQPWLLDKIRRVNHLDWLLYESICARVRLKS